MTLTVGSLFSGIGGIDLGLERAGMTVRWQSEIDPYCARVLAKHWPEVPNLGDITRINWTEVEPVDVICGGYPCQPFSLAGSRQGTDDPRHLWPWMLAALRSLRPRYALMENVPGHLSLGFDRVLGDLAEIGFDAEWDCIPAAAVGAPHLRYRIFIVAYASHVFGNGRDDHPRIGVGTEPVPEFGNGGRTQNMADAHEIRRRRRSRIFRPKWRGQLADGGQWEAEPAVGRVAHGVPHRVDRLRALGNAVVPQVAEHVGRMIMEAAA